MTCTIDYNLDDRPESMIALVRSMHLLFNAECSWRLDLHACAYLGPNAGAMIAATVLHARSRGLAPEVVLPSEPRELVEFCYASALQYYVAATPFPGVPTRRPETIPMQVLRQSSFSDPDPFITLLRRHIDTDADVEDYLRVCINEAVQNVQDHAESPIGAIAAARYMSRPREIRIVIVDRGVGIGTTIRRRYPEIPDARAAISRVMEGGITAKSRSNNMGVGISNLCAIVQHQLGGRVFILSENAGVNRQPSRRDVCTSLDFPYPGTAVFINVPVEH